MFPHPVGRPMLARAQTIRPHDAGDIMHQKGARQPHLAAPASGFLHDRKLFGPPGTEFGNQDT